MSKKLNDPSLPKLDEHVISEAEAWLLAHKDEIPPSVASALKFGLTFATRFSNAGSRFRSLLVELRRALGVVPSSEKKNSGSPQTGLPNEKRQRAKEEKERLIRERDRLMELCQWYRNLMRRHGKKLKKLSEKIMKLDEIDLTEQDIKEMADEQKAFEARLALGEGRCDMDSAKPTEDLMAGVGTHLETKPQTLEVDRASLPKGARVKQQFFEERERLSFSFTVTRLELSVEKLAVETKAGSTLVAASLDEIGPPKMRITWEFLANMSLLACQYALPLNRFAALASSEAKHFTGAEISRYFRYTASRFAEIYVHLGGSLTNVDVLSGDDTPSRVIEVTNALKIQDPKKAFPWEAYGTAEQAKLTVGTLGSDAPLGARLAEHFGFESEKKDGSGPKRALNTTVLSGRSDPLDPKSTIIFYRSHIGGLGNLLDMILKKRDRTKNKVVVQSDLSTTNLISDADLKSWLEVTLAGCTFHARRPFAIYENDDPDLCAQILHAFKGIAIFEKSLDLVGRNRENTLAVRDIDERAAWEEVRRGAELVIKRWAKDTPLGEGGHYVLRHFDRLTYYLSDHRLMPSNNFSERMLRLECLIEDGAHFRQTLEGRFSLDIMRTVLQTAIAAGVNLEAYLLWVMRMPADVVARSPKDFTPLAFAKHCASENL